MLMDFDLVVCHYLLDNFRRENRMGLNQVKFFKYSYFPINYIILFHLWSFDYGRPASSVLIRNLVGLNFNKISLSSIKRFLNRIHHNNNKKSPLKLIISPKLLISSTFVSNARS